MAERTPTPPPASDEWNRRLRNAWRHVPSSQRAPSPTWDYWQDAVLRDVAAAQPAQEPAGAPEPPAPPQDPTEAWNVTQRGWWGQPAHDEPPTDDEPQADDAEAFDAALRRAFGS